MHSSLVADSAEDSPEVVEVSKVVDFPAVSAGVSRSILSRKARCPVLAEAVLAADSE